MSSSELDMELSAIQKLDTLSVLDAADSEADKKLSKHNCCRKPKYQLRKISSKAAVLVLVWNTLTTSIFGSLDNLDAVFDLTEDPISTVVPYITLFISALFAGWLADTYLGHYHTAKIGFVLLFIGSVMQSVLIVARHVSDVHYKWPEGLSIAMVTLTAAIGYGSVAIQLVTLLQVGLDQMPDSSVRNITSFIAWFVFSVFIGFWISEFSSNIGSKHCFGHYFPIVWSLFPVACMAIVLISDIFLTPKWLIIEPKSSQSLKSIYQILDFAAKHKAPPNRSSLTYWEESLPSRIDFSKMKYGGPYSIEQVENVKTLFRILALSVPLWASMTSFYMLSNTIDLISFNGTILDDNWCPSQAIKYLTYDWFLLAMVLIVIYEFAVYPLIGNRIPTALRRMGVSTLLIAIFNTVTVAISVAYYFDSYVPVIVAYLHEFVSCVIIVMLLTASIEFVTAQSPYNMRGLLLGYVWCINSFTFALAYLILYGILKIENQKVVLLVHTVVASVLGCFGLVAFVFLSRWYKGRIREDVVTPHMFVEEAYDRYLS